MNAESALIAENIEAYLHQHEHKTLLRFITCGSVDDGKSTLIGRFLYESKMLFEDQLRTLRADSARMGTQGSEIDFSLAVDGLEAEREQKITIDVAYRFFSTDKRKFIVADTPGHEQYTRNMITGASTADVAVILIDARKGVLTQTCRHSYLVSLIGIRNIALAVNKMDLVDYSQTRFDEIVNDCRAFAGKIGLENITPIPLSALKGDNMLSRSPATPWYSGPTLMEYLENVEIEEGLQARPFRLPVQWVIRPDLDFRGFAGTIASGAVHVGDRIRVLPSGRESTVARIVTMDGDLESAVAEQSIQLTLNDEIDVSRGDLICPVDAPAGLSDGFEATIVWMTDEPMLPGRAYRMKIGPTTVTATPSGVKYKVDVNTLDKKPARQLELNEIGVCTVTTDRPVAFDAYRDNRETGGFILIDRWTNNTVGAGLIHFGLHRAQNVHHQTVDVDKVARAKLKSQKPAVIWLTGLSGSGKLAIANLLEKRLHASGRHTYLLDGENIRLGLNRDLGFTDVARVENIRRSGEVARMLVDAGLIVIASFISPFRNERETARGLLAPGEFFEVFVDMPLKEAERRDPKGLYRKARSGELPNFTGIGSPYERPEHPEVHLDMMKLSTEEAVERILSALKEKGVTG
jgi:bifunctional enzyme CysN/CysC